MTLLTRDGVHLRLGRDAALLHDDRDHAAVDQASEKAGIILVAALFHIPQQPRVQFLLVQRAFEIDDQSIPVLFKVPHVRAGGKRQRPADAKVREQ